MFTDKDRQALLDIKHVLSWRYGEPDIGRNFGEDRVIWDGKLDAILKAVAGSDAESILAEIRAQGETTRAVLEARLAELAPVLAQAVADKVDHTLEAAAEALRTVFRSIPDA